MMVQEQGHRTKIEEQFEAKFLASSKMLEPTLGVKLEGPYVRQAVRFLLLL